MHLSARAKIAVYIVGVLALIAWGRTGAAGSLPTKPPAAALPVKAPSATEAAALGKFSNGNVAAFTTRCVAGSNVVQVSGGADFAAGQSVVIPFCGDPPRSPAPLHPPQVTPDCAGDCVDSYIYRYAGVDVDGGITKAGPASQPVRNARALDLMHHNLIALAPIAGAISYALWRSSDQGRSWIRLNQASTARYDDFGQPASRASIIPAAPLKSALADELVSTVVSSSGGKLTLAKPASATVSSAVFHADDRIFQLAAERLGAGGEVWLPKGNFAISRPIEIHDCTGYRLQGAGMWATVLRATAALGGRPVILFVNCHEALVADLSINGNPSASPSAGIEFMQNEPRKVTATDDRVSRVAIGGSASASVVDGIVFSAVTDINNDQGIIEGSLLYNFSDCGVVAGNINSIQHRLVKNIIEWGPCGVQDWNGSFVDAQGIYNSILPYPKGVIYDLQNFGAQLHHSVVSRDMSSESGSMVLRAAPGYTDYVQLIGLDYDGGVPGGRLIEFDSPNGVLDIVASHIYSGQPGTGIYASGVNASLSLIGDSLNVSNIVSSGSLTSIGNTFTAPTQLRALHLVECGSSGTRRSACSLTPEISASLHRLPLRRGPQ